MSSRPARRRSAIARLVALTVVPFTALPLAAAPAATAADPASASPRLAAAAKAKKPGTVKFVSRNGSAEFGSTAALTLTNLKTDKVTEVSVTGAGTKTTATVKVPAGRYQVGGEDSTANGVTYSLRLVKPTNGLITVKSPTKRSKKPTVVDFGLETIAPDLTLTPGESTPRSVSLSWTGPDDVTEYVLRRTTGATPASSPTDGEGVPLSDPTSTTDSGLSGGTAYTYTLFANRSGGQEAAPVSAYVSTPAANGSAAAFSLAPDTLMATDEDALDASDLGGGKVAVTLPGSATARTSVTSEIFTDTSARRAAPDVEACVVGSPFLADTATMGDEAFYGIVESCGGGGSAVIDTDVPLDAVFTTLDAERSLDHGCKPLEATGQETPAQGGCVVGDPDNGDTDGDGLRDGREEDLGTDPRDPDTDDDGFNDWDEYFYDTDPLDPTSFDSDYDYLSDQEEPDFGTDPFNCDTDGDTFDDGNEVISYRTDPTDPESKPQGSTSAGCDGRGGPGDAGRRVAGDIAPADTSFMAQAKPKLSCEGSGSRKVALNPFVSPGGNASVKLESGKLTWDIQAFVTAGINPSIKLSGKYECGIDFKGVSFQITVAPVPINLNLAPLARASAEASFTLEGPELSLKAGFKTKGKVETSYRYCSTWGFRYKCGIGVDTTSDNGLIKEGKIGPVTATLQGTLGLDLGITATIAIGYEGTFGGVKAGFAFDIVPLAATLSAVRNKSDRCFTLALGGKVGIGVVATAWILFKSWNLTFERDLKEWEFDYGLSKQYGQCS